MRSVQLSVLTMTTLVLSGCTLDPYQREVQRLQPQVESLEQRVGRLEEVRFGSSKSGTAAGSENMTFGDSAESSGRQIRFSSLIPSRKAFGKLGRGIVNVVTGWVEIPKRVHETSQTSGALKGLTWGLARGLGYGFIRTAGGAYETVTFPFPAPRDYRPVMRPAYVFADDES